MHFKDVIGQENIKLKLLQSVKNSRISHAQLFLGPEGSGNLALAIAYAQYIQCENPTENEACGICRSCKQMRKLIHPDVHFVFPVNTSNTIKKDAKSDSFIDKWRLAVIENPYLNLNQWYEFIGIENKQGIINKSDSVDIIKKLSLKPYESEYNILIIWMPELMNRTSSNMLLKLIEEPPTKTLFLLISENTDKILTTIISRTQLVKLPGINNTDIETVLIEKHNLPEDRAKLFSQMVNGNYNLALTELDEDNGDEFNFNSFITLMRTCYSNNTLKTLYWIDEIAPIGREKLKSFLTYAINLMRENLMLNLDQDKLVFLPSKEFEWSKKFSPFINTENIYNIIEELSSAHKHISQNANSKIVLTDMSLKLMKLINS